MPFESEPSLPLSARVHVNTQLAREAIVCGLMGAVAIMIWFFVLDASRGRPLYTPTVLGTILVQRGQGVAALGDLPISLGMVALYTVVHTAAFCVVGAVSAWLFSVAERHPPYIFGLLLFFIFFFCGFLGIAVLFEFPFHRVVSIWAIMAGNLLAAVTMGRYLWRRHPLDLRKLL